jgi:hypothetical protein
MHYSLNFLLKLLKDTGADADNQTTLKLSCNNQSQYNSYVHSILYALSPIKMCVAQIKNHIFSTISKFVQVIRSLNISLKQWNFYFYAIWWHRWHTDTDHTEKLEKVGHWVNQNQLMHEKMRKINSILSIIWLNMIWSNSTNYLNYIIIALQ